MIKERTRTESAQEGRKSREKGKTRQDNLLSNVQRHNGNIKGKYQRNTSQISQLLWVFYSMDAKPKISIAPVWVLEGVFFLVCLFTNQVFLNHISLYQNTKLTKTSVSGLESDFILLKIKRKLSQAATS